jgi:hypothetical protein
MLKLTSKTMRGLFLVSIASYFVACAADTGEEPINLKHYLSDLENSPEKGIESIVTFLRAKDFRMVRLGISAESKQRQKLLSDIEGSHEQILKLIAPERSIILRKKAAEAIHLMSNENYGVAQQIGLQSWLPDSYGISDLLGMVKDGSAVSEGEDTVFMGEEAAEAIWTLSRSSLDNLEMLIDKGAISILIHVVMSDITPRFTMLACASLKRLLADQFNTPDGTYSSMARRIINNEQARKNATDTPGFISRLVDLVQNGRVLEATPRAEWPRYAEVSNRLKPSIQAWAAAAALGTIGLNKQSRAEVSAAGGLGAICALKLSPDALEALEAVYALQGLDGDCSGGADL